MTLKKMWLVLIVVLISTEVALGAECVEMRLGVRAADEVQQAAATKFGVEHTTFRIEARAKAEIGGDKTYITDDTLGQQAALRGGRPQREKNLCFRVA